MTSKIIPVGPRVLVREIEPVAEMEQRAKRAGLFLAMFEQNKPKATTGVITALGSDPEVQRLLKVGDVVYFHSYAGTQMMVEGASYRMLEFHEITSVVKEEEAPEEEAPSPA